MNCVPLPCWTPAVALVPPPPSVPYTTSKLELFSCSSTSKLAVDAGVAKYTARHSTVNTRFGADPVTDVKIPHVPPGKLEHPAFASVLRSSQCGKIALLYGAPGRHVFVNVDVPDVNTSTPFESACTFENDVPYNETENGSEIGVRQSSQALPVSVVAAVNVPAPLDVEYPGLHVAVAVGVAVGGVPVDVAVGVPHTPAPLVRRCTSLRNWKVAPSMPPTLQICPAP